VRLASLPANPVQVAYFFLAVWLTFKFESTHRQSFLRHLGVQPSEATEYNNTSYIESIFLSCNVLGIACMVTTDVLGTQTPPLTAACLALPVLHVIRCRCNMPTTAEAGLASGQVSADQVTAPE